MIDYCSQCTYLNIDGEKNYGKYWCDNLKEWRYANSDICRYYCDAYSRSSSTAQKAFDYSKQSQQSSGCMITTINNILSMDDNNIYLNNMRFLRDNYLQKNEKGIELLIKYDEIGPQISKCISEDSGKFNIAYTLFNNYIVPITLNIMDKKYDEAIVQYTEMTSKLIKYYHLDENVKTKVEEVVPFLSGHGVLQKKLA